MKKVVVSFSGGKDSMLALHRVIKNGFEVCGLITTVNSENKESWFHNISLKYLKELSDSLNIPLILIECSGEKYENSFENTLKNLKAQGIEGCVFGDIDIEDHKKWCTDRCVHSGVEAFFPLWQENREDLVNEVISLGYKAIIKKVNLKFLNESFLGKTLSKEIVEEIKLAGSDPCGENGEYHTFIYDGPLLTKKIEIKFSDIKSNDLSSFLNFI